MDALPLLGPLALILVAAILFIMNAVRVVQEYERGVIFRLGRLVGARGPGLFFIIPGLERMVKVDLRTVTMDVPAQEAITRDNVTVRVNAVVYFRVLTPEDAIVRVLDYMRATSMIAQTTLRSVLGQSDLDELLAERDVDAVMYPGWEAIDAFERARGEEQGRPRVKLCTWEELLAAARGETVAARPAK